MTALLTRPPTRDTATAAPPWRAVALAVFLIAWGGNEFTPLLVMYRVEFGFDAVAVGLLLFAYVLGIVPALLVGGPLSDRLGRRALMLPAPLIAVAGSAVLAAGAGHGAVLFAGRVLSGVAIGLAMAVGGSWLKELSSAPWDAAAAPSAGARRAAMALTGGFAAGAAVAGVLAQWAPWPGSLAYLLHIAVTLPAAALLRGAPETLAPENPGISPENPKTSPGQGRRRFLVIVVPLAPWVFGAASSAYAVLPGMMIDRSGGHPVAFSALLCTVALGCGFAVQSLGRRIDVPGTARASVAAAALLVAGMAVAAVATSTLAAGWVLLAAAVLGLGYGLALVAGLLEVQRIAGPGELAGLTAVFYSLAYLGFAVPPVMAYLARWVGHPVMFACGAAAAAATLAVVAARPDRRAPR